MGTRRILQGIVVSSKMDKTISVELRDLVQHPLFQRVIRRRTRVKAHDPLNSASEGDIVRVMETRPFSKTKKFALVSIVKKSVG